VLTLESLPRLQALIADQRLDGWLLFDFKGRNPIASAVLGNWIVGTRRVFVKIPRSGAPVALVHEIDKELWLNWPKEWIKHIYIRREDLETEVAALVSGERLALDFSPRGAVPYLDCVPAGLKDFLTELGAQLLPSIDLVTRFCSLWTPDDHASHVRAARIVAEIAIGAMRAAGENSRLQEPLREHGLAVWIREAFERAGLTTESGPSVSFGANAARNHYEPSAEGSASLVPGQLLLIDLWAREPGGIYADQTWMAAIGAPSDRDAQLWQVVRQSRDQALDLLCRRVRERTPVQGAELDRAAKRVIHEAGFGGNVASRTGHSIDRFGLHGFGPPIDDTKTWDSRLLIPRVGFSVEPGIYFAGETGVRSEVNACVGDGEVLITPDEYQKDLTVL
jgi:Xaa-Pro dipeptidase